VWVDSISNQKQEQCTPIICASELGCNLFILLLLLRRFGPFSGHGHPVAGISRQLSFYEVRVSAPSPALNQEGRCLSLFVPHLAQKLSGMDGPTCSLAAAGTAFQFSGAHKFPTRRKTPSTTWRYQRGRLRRFKLICVPKPHHVLHLTLRLLMSYTYIYIYIYIYMEHLFLMFLDHTQRRSTVGRTPLDE